jgi:hypothetical protein
MDIGHGVAHASAALAGNREDRVADELARTVVRDIASAVGTDEFGTDVVGCHEDVRGISPHAEREHVRMLEQQKVIVRRALEQRVLQCEGVAVADTTEPPDAQHFF